MRWIWPFLLVGCSGGDFASSAAVDAGDELELDAAVDAGDELAAVDAAVDAHDELAAADGTHGEPLELEAAVDARDELVANVDARDARAEAEAGPPPLTCKSMIGQCEATSPWPYACCRSSPCECCNMPNCGRP